MLAFAGIVTLAVNAQTVTDTLPASTEDTTIAFPVPQEDNATTLQDKLSKAVDITMKITVVIQIFLACYMISFTLLVIVNDCKKKHTKTEWYTLKAKNATYLQYLCILNATFLFLTISRILLAQNNDMKMDINMAVLSAIIMLVYLTLYKSVLKLIRTATTLEDKLTYIMYGKLPEDMTDEDKAEQPANHDKAMTRMGWANAVSAWHSRHKNDPKYLTSDKEALFSLAQASDMAQTFYLQGRQDEKDGITEYDRLWQPTPKE